MAATIRGETILRKKVSTGYYQPEQKGMEEKKKCAGTDEKNLSTKSRVGR